MAITKENLDRNYPKSSTSSNSHYSNNSLFLPNLSHHESLGSTMGHTTMSTAFSSADSSSVSKIPDDMHSKGLYEDSLDRNGDEDSMDAASLNMTYFGEHGMMGGSGVYSINSSSQMPMSFTDYASNRIHPSDTSASVIKKSKPITSESTSIGKGNMKTGSDHNSDNYSSGDMSENDEEKEKYKVRLRNETIIKLDDIAHMLISII